MHPVVSHNQKIGRPHELQRPLATLCEKNLSPLHLKLLFELSLEDNPSIARYEPEFYSAGGEHIVYALDNRPGLVAKLHVDDVLHGCATAVGCSIASRELHAPAERIALENSRLSTLQNYFGPGALLRQRNVVHELHLSQLMLAAITENREFAHDLRMPLGITFQQVAGILQHPEQRSLTIGIAEAAYTPRNSYAAATERYVYGEETSYHHALAMRAAQPYLWTTGIMGLLACNHAFLECIRDFVSRAARYMNETGEGLDLFGGENVAFAPSRAGWEYKLIDGLYPVPALRERAYRACAALVRDELPDIGEALCLRNYLNLVRSINFLAECTGGDQRITPIPSELRVRADQLLKTLAAFDPH